MPNKNVPVVQGLAIHPGTSEIVDRLRKPERREDDSNNGDARLPVVLLVASMVLLVALLVLMIRSAASSDPSIHALFFVGFLMIFPLVFISLDVVLFDRKRSHLPDPAPDNKHANKPAYHPNLRIWGIGLMMGIGSTIVYLMGDVVLSFINTTSVTNEIIHQYILLLAVLTIGVGLTIWGIVRVCQGE